MTAPPSFGRRRPATPSPQAVRSPPRPAPTVELSPEAEAFRAELAAAPRAAKSDFAAWCRSRTGQSLLYWILTIACLSPGLVGVLLNAPGGVSAALEVAGLLVGAWLRYERRRRLREIVAWEQAAAEP